MTGFVEITASKKKRLFTRAAWETAVTQTGLFKAKTVRLQLPEGTPRKRLEKAVEKLYIQELALCNYCFFAGEFEKEVREIARRYGAAEPKTEKLKLAFFDKILETECGNFRRGQACLVDFEGTRTSAAVLEKLLAMFRQVNVVTASDTYYDKVRGRLLESEGAAIIITSDLRTAEGCELVVLCTENDSAPDDCACNIIRLRECKDDLDDERYSANFSVCAKLRAAAPQCFSDYKIAAAVTAECAATDVNIKYLT